MTRRRQWAILGMLGAVYLAVLGVLTGVVSERVRFDGATSGILHQLDEAARRARTQTIHWQRQTRAAEQPAAAPATSAPNRHVSWTAALQTFDAALSRGDLRAAERAWRAAHVPALRSRAWHPLIAVGDAALRLAEVSGDRSAGAGRARKAYMAALARARAARSAEGVLRVAESFDALGDREVVEQCLIIAERLGTSVDNEATRRLHALGHRTPAAQAAPSIEP